MNLKYFFNSLKKRATKQPFFYQENQLNINRKQAEHGRSMIEMLGVLAIVGLLGISGYSLIRYAFNYFAAGTVQEVITQSKALAATKQIKSNISLSQFLKKTSINRYKPHVEQSDGADNYTVYIISLPDISQDVQKFVWSHRKNYAQVGIIVNPSAELAKTTGLQDVKELEEWDMRTEEIQRLESFISVKEAMAFVYAVGKRKKGSHTNTTPSWNADEEDLDCNGQSRPYAKNGRLFNCEDEEYYDRALGICVPCNCRVSGVKWNKAANKCECVYPDQVYDSLSGECHCPEEKPHWQDEKCVECLNNSHCTDKGNKHVCNTTQYICEPCPSDNPYWNGSACVECLNNSHCTDKGDKHVCNTSNYLCEPCPSNKPQWNGSACVECLNNNHCIDKGDKHVCNTSNYLCEPCPSNKPQWNGTACVECLNNSHCIGKGDKHVCNTSNYLCEPCPSDKPQWNGSACVECLNNSHCIDKGDKHVCNTSNYLCEPCPSDNPYWNGSECIRCNPPMIFNSTKNKCVCPSTTPLLQGSTCVACPTGQTYDSETEKCVCPSNKPYLNGTTCVQCLNNSHCSSNQYCDVDNTCKTFKACTEGTEFRSATGACVDCSANGSYEISTAKFSKGGITDSKTPKEQCNACSFPRSVQTVNSKLSCVNGCPNGSGFVPLDVDTSNYKFTLSKISTDQYKTTEYKNKCISCNTIMNKNLTYTMPNTSETACKTCGGSVWNTELSSSHKVCGRKACPDGNFLVQPGSVNGYGDVSPICYSCSTHNKTHVYVGKDSDVQALCTASKCGRKVVNNRCVKDYCSSSQFLEAPYESAATPKGYTCHSCTDSTSYRIGTTDEELKFYGDSCKKCSSRKIELSGGVYYCTAGTTCSSNSFKGKDGVCYPCSQNDAIEVLAEAECNKCTNRWAVKQSNIGSKTLCMKKCATNQFQGVNGTCYSCSTSSSIALKTVNNDVYSQLDDLCRECTTKRDVSGASQCYLVPTCSSTQFHNSNGECVNCSSTTVAVSTKADYKIECEACPASSATNKGRTYLNGKCVIINPGTSGSCNSLGDASGNNPYPAGDNALFRSTDDGTCKKCDVADQISVSGYTEQCRQCEEWRHLSDGLCLKNPGCTSGLTFWSIPQQECVSCSISTKKVQTTARESDLCTGCNRQIMTYQGKTYCLKKCGTNKWQDTNGDCFDCSTNSSNGNVIGDDEASLEACRACGRTPVYQSQNNQYTCVMPGA